LEEVFKEIKKEQQLKSRHIFTYQPNEHKRKKSMLSEKLVALQIGRTFRRVDTAFKAALKRASIEDFKFHDLRHTFASQMIMRGASLKEVQELLGHKEIKMTMRYAHLSQEHKKKAVNLLNGLTAPKNPPIEKVTKRSHFQNPPSNPL
jgi:site-specific recombinase XerD